MADHTQIVADEDIGQTEIGTKFHEQVEHLRLNRYIQRGHGLVAHQQIRFDRQRPGDADALALAAGELVRETSPHVWVEADTSHGRIEALGERLGWPKPMHPRALPDQLAHA